MIENVLFLCWWKMVGFHIGTATCKKKINGDRTLASVVGSCVKRVLGILRGGIFFGIFCQGMVEDLITDLRRDTAVIERRIRLRVNLY